MDINELKTHLQSTVEEIKSHVEKRDKEVAEFGEAGEQTRKELTAATENLDAIKAELDREATERKGMDDRLQELEAKLQRDFGKSAEDANTLGKMFIESDEFKSASSRGLRSTGTFTAKNISSLAASAGALVRPDRRPDVVIAPDRPRFVRELLPSLPTTSNAVEVMRQNVFTNAAGLQSPATPDGAIGAGELQAKPASNITYDQLTVPIRTMSHWIPASRQVLTDAPQLQRLIDTRLVYGLNLLGDAQLLYGDGTNQNLTGLMVDSGISSTGGLPPGTTAADVAGAMLDHIRRGVTQLQTREFYNVNGLTLNPQDWEKLELAKGSDGHYIWVTVPNGGEPRLWRVPVIVTNAMQPGEFLMGDWTLGATVYDREQIDIRVAEQHEEFFVKNAVAVLAEERYGFGIELPGAFQKGSFEVSAA